MAIPHAYTVHTLDRAKIGYCMGMLACVLSAVFVSILDEILSFFTFEVNKIILLPISGGTFYVLIYWLINKVLWKTFLGKKFFHIPDISGTWICQGKSFKSTNLNLCNEQHLHYSWNAEIKISQDWDKLLIVLDRNESSSNSIMATLIPSYDNLQYHELSYVYENTPKYNAPPDMKKHDGFCRLKFAPGEKEAEGFYFTNSRDRISHGTMKLTKK